MKAVLLFVPLVLASVALASTAPPCEDQAKMVTEFGDRFAWERSLLPNEDKPLDADSDVRYIRILLRRMPSTSDKWRLTIRDGVGRPLQTIGSRQIPPGGTLWTERLPTRSVRLQAQDSTEVEPIAQTLEYIQVLKNAKRPYYSKQGPVPAWVDLFDDSTVPPLMRRRSEAVGMFIGTEGNAVDGISVWTCSGFVLANYPAVLFVTNDHCGGNWKEDLDRWTAAICQNALVDFSWDGDGVSRDYACDKVVARSPAKDLAVLRLRPLKNEAPPQPVIVRRQQATDEEVFVIHHPAADTKKISRTCVAITSGLAAIPTVNTSSEFAHRCDTESGSSGAPVFDADGRLVAIHHMGFQKTPAGTCDRLNKAVHASKLLDLLRRNPQLVGYQIE